MRSVSLFALVSSLAAVAANPVVVDGPEGNEAPESPCAPAIQCTAKLAADELLAVEAGTDGRGGEGELVYTAQTVVRFALHERLELHLYTNTLILAGAEPRSHEGFQPGFRATLLDESSWLPSQALSGYLTLPTFDPSQTWDFEAWWTMSKTVGVLKADLNVMFALNDVLGAPLPHGLAMLTVRTAISGRVSLFGEAFGTWGQLQARPPGVGLFSGVSLAAAEQLVLDVGAEVALHETQQPRVTVFAGITWVPSAASKRPSSPLAARLDWP